MMFKSSHWPFPILIVCLIAILVLALCALATGVTISLVWEIPGMLVLVALSLFKRLRPLFWLVYFVSTSLVLLLLVQIPIGAFNAWTESVQVLKAAGSISSLFLALVSLTLTLIIYLYLNKMLLHALFVLITTCLIACLVIFKLAFVLPFLLLILVAFLLVDTKTASLKQLAKGFKLRWPQLSLVLGASLLIGTMSYPHLEGSGLASVNRYLVPGIISFFEKHLPSLASLVKFKGHKGNNTSLDFRTVPFMDDQVIFWAGAITGSSWYLKLSHFDTLSNNVWKKNSSENGTDDTQKAGLSETKSSFSLNLFVSSALIKGVPYLTSDREVWLKRKEDAAFARIKHADIEQIILYEGDQLGYGLNPSRVEKQNPASLKDQAWPVSSQVSAIIEEFLADLDLNRESLNIAQTISMLQAKFSAEFSYNLDYKETAWNSLEEFCVDFFVKSKQGWCSHFATAMALVLYHLEIPSRYVSGYLLQMNSPLGSQAITSKQAHAWLEVYNKADASWYRVEATPSLQSNTPRQITDLQKNPATTDDSDTEKKVDQTLVGSSIGWILAIAVLVLLISCFIFFYKFLRLENRWRRVLKTISRLSAADNKRTRRLAVRLSNLAESHAWGSRTLRTRDFRFARSYLKRITVRK